MLPASMCPHCRTVAPLVYRGVRAYCAACGRPRGVLSGASLTHAGKPAHVAGAVLHAFGWLLLLLGLGFSALMGLFMWLFSGTAALVTFGIFGGLSLALFLLARYGKKRLESEGDTERDKRREQALVALAANRGGRLQAYEAASALDVTVDEADKILTSLAKTKPDEVDVEIGDQGEIFYAFTRQQFAGGGAYVAYGAVWGGPGGFRVATSSGPMPDMRARDAKPSRVRVAPSDDADRSADSIAQREILDAEFEAIEEDAQAKKRRS